MGKTIIIALIIVILLILLYNICKKKEYAILTEPTFYKSVVADERGSLKDKRGMTVNDFALESKLLTGIPLTQGYRIQ